MIDLRHQNPIWLWKDEKDTASFAPQRKRKHENGKIYYKIMIILGSMWTITVIVGTHPYCYCYCHRVPFRCHLFYQKWHPIFCLLRYNYGRRPTQYTFTMPSLCLRSAFALEADAGRRQHEGTTPSLRLCVCRTTCFMVLATLIEVFFRPNVRYLK